MTSIKSSKQEILVGSSKLASDQSNYFDRTKYMLDNMHFNKAYLFEISKKNSGDKKLILEKFKDNFKKYRDNWVNVSKNYKEQIKFDKNSNIHQPLSIDIETASICDLACPHCSREYIVTPDKIMGFDLYKKLINEASLLNVPSVKLNWRGEPLLNPKIHEYIAYAKEKGILEVSINTNAVALSKKRSESLIKSGLDVIIFSFDGGTKKTYEKMRPGRFNKNSFESVYNNIKNFCLTKKEMNAKFPITKIQMVLTYDSRNEIKNFYDIFANIIDDVTVTQYNERGGSINDLTEEQKLKVKKYFKENNLPETTPYMVDINENIFVSTKRKPCEQIFQRLMVTFDGRVGMCCHDWGAQHGIGFVSKDAFSQKSYLDVKNSIDIKKKGFELLKHAKMPREYNEPKHQEENLNSIWRGEELNKVRNLHNKGKVNDLPVCKDCTFKDTFDWTLIN